MPPENQILGITPPEFPLFYDGKIFKSCICEDECDCPLESYNDKLENLISLSGVNEELYCEYFLDNRARNNKKNNIKPKE